MDVYQVSVRFSRKVQAKEYEPVEGEVTLSANVHPGEDVGAIASQLMTTARQTVIDGLRGGPAPKTETSTAALTSSTEPKTASVADSAGTGDATTGEKRRAGRPVGSGKKDAAAQAPTETKPAESKPAPAVEEIPDETTAGNKPGAGAAAASAAVAADIPDEKPDEKPAPAATQAPAPAASALTADELQSYITKMVQAKKVSVQRIKDILASHGVARTSEIPPTDLQTVKDEIELAAMG